MSRSHIIPANASEDVIAVLLGKMPSLTRRKAMDVGYFELLYAPGTEIQSSHFGTVTVLWWIDEEFARVRLETPDGEYSMRLMKWQELRMMDQEAEERERADLARRNQALGYAWGEMSRSLQDACHNIALGFQRAFNKENN